MIIGALHFKNYLIRFSVSRTGQNTVQITLKQRGYLKNASTSLSPPLRLSASRSGGLALSVFGSGSQVTD
jgi:hypothetical protein